MAKPPSGRKKTTATTISKTKPPTTATDEENPSNATITVAAVEVPELTEEESRERLHLERKVERAFFEAGKALKELRDRRLYRTTHRTFEDYCRERFGYTHRRVNYLIASSLVFDNIMGTNGSQILEKEGEMGTNGSLQEIPDAMGTNREQILPTSERQVRPLVTLEAEVQRDAWQQAVKAADGQVPSHRIVSDVVQRIMERTQVPNTYCVGEVCQILAKDNPELRGLGGCWAIVSQVNDFSCTVKMWNGEYTVSLQHLKSFNYLPTECDDVQQISDRCLRVYSDSLEDTAKSVLQLLGKLTRPYLTAVEEKLLSVLEG